MRHRPDADPAQLSPKERRQEVAAILAKGLLRLQIKSRTSTETGQSDDSQNSPDSSKSCLDLSSKSSPPVRPEA